MLLEVILRALLLVVVCMILVGCTGAFQPMGSYSASPDSACTWEPEHFKATGEAVGGAYVCPVESSRSKYAGNLCVWVDGYTRKDGTVALGHTRCKYNGLPASNYSTSGASANDAPCVSSSCGPVQVKGYFRKDGTYVRPHTRSRKK